MGSYSIYRFLIQGFLALLLVNTVQSSSTKRAAELTSELQLEAYHLRQLDRIVNGSQASPVQFPHKVSLRFIVTDSHFCGGSIIDAGWILTAAHCMFDGSTGAQLQAWMLLVVAGDLLLNQPSITGQRSTVTEIIIHENYNSITLRHDIALLKLATNMTFDNYAVGYQVLQKHAVAAGTYCQVAGWGYAQSGVPPVVNELMYVDVPIVSHTLCQQLYVNFSSLPAGMICAGYIEGLRDACQGDSGGGLICNGILSGVVSWGYGCAQPKFPGVYTDVRYYRNWILQRSQIVDRASGARLQFSPWTMILPFAVIGLMIKSYD